MPRTYCVDDCILRPKLTTNLFARKVQSLMKGVHTNVIKSSLLKSIRQYIGDGLWRDWYIQFWICVSPDCSISVLQTHVICRLTWFYLYALENEIFAFYPTFVKAEDPSIMQQKRVFRFLLRLIRSKLYRDITRKITILEYVIIHTRLGFRGQLASCTRLLFWRQGQIFWREVYLKSCMYIWHKGRSVFLYWASHVARCKQPHWHYNLYNKYNIHWNIKP